MTPKITGSDEKLSLNISITDEHVERAAQLLRAHPQQAICDAHRWRARQILEAAFAPPEEPEIPVSPAMIDAGYRSYVKWNEDARVGAIKGAMSATIYTAMERARLKEQGTKIYRLMTDEMVSDQRSGRDRRKDDKSWSALPLSHPPIPVSPAMKKAALGVWDNWPLTAAPLERTVKPREDLVAAMFVAMESKRLEEAQEARLGAQTATEAAERSRAAQATTVRVDWTQVGPGYTEDGGGLMRALTAEKNFLGEHLHRRFHDSMGVNHAHRRKDDK